MYSPLGWLILRHLPFSFIYISATIKPLLLCQTHLCGTHGSLPFLLHDQSETCCTGHQKQQILHLWVFKIFYLELGGGKGGGELYSLSLSPATGKSDNFVRLGYIHLHLFYLEIDVPLILCRQRLEQSTSLHILWSSIFDDCAQYHLINCIKALQRFPVSCRLRVCCQLLQHSLSTNYQPWCSGQAHTVYLNWCNSKKSKASWFSYLEFYIIILPKIPVPWRKWIENNEDKVASSI